MIAAHVGPDGDALGSGLALRYGLEQLGKEAWVISSDGVPNNCRYLPGWEEVMLAPPQQPQCALIVDCDGTPNRVAAPFVFVEKAKARGLIDHHRTAQPIFDANWLDFDQPATAMMIYELLGALGAKLTPAIAQCLLCGISTDTGHFRHDNTSPAVLMAAADFVRAGADVSGTAFKLFDERSLASTRLTGLGLGKMQSECDGQLLWTALSENDFAKADAFDESSEGLVNTLRSVRGVRMAMVMRERRDETGPTARVSVRCHPSMRADLFCQKFGGGGHAAASGCRVRFKPFAQAVESLVEAAREWVVQSHPPVSEAHEE